MIEATPHNNINQPCSGVPQSHAGAFFANTTTLFQLLQYCNIAILIFRARRARTANIRVLERYELNTLEWFSTPNVALVAGHALEIVIGTSIFDAYKLIVLGSYLKVLAWAPPAQCPHL